LAEASDFLFASALGCYWLHFNPAISSALEVSGGFFFSGAPLYIIVDQNSFGVLFAFRIVFAAG
jgi:hypothetical protein